MKSPWAWWDGQRVFWGLELDIFLGVGWKGFCKLLVVKSKNVNKKNSDLADRVKVRKMIAVLMRASLIWLYTVKLFSTPYDPTDRFSPWRSVLDLLFQVSQWWSSSLGGLKFSEPWVQKCTSSEKLDGQNRLNSAWVLMREMGRGEWRSNQCVLDHHQLGWLCKVRKMFQLKYMLEGRFLGSLHRGGLLICWNWDKNCKYLWHSCAVSSLILRVGDVMQTLNEWGVCVKDKVELHLYLVIFEYQIYFSLYIRYPWNLQY